MQSQLSGSYTLSWTYSDHESNRFDSVTNPFNLADEWAFSASDQRHRFIVNGVTRFRGDIQAGMIFFAGSKRPINTRTNLDPLGAGVGRWLDATGRTIPRNSERTTKNDYKLDLRLSKEVRVGHLRLEGLLEAFNVLNTKNFGNFNGLRGSGAGRRGPRERPSRGPGQSPGIVRAALSRIRTCCRSRNALVRHRSRDRCPASGTAAPQRDPAGARQSSDSGPGKSGSPDRQ
jgi:hypothetical protein